MTTGDAVIRCRGLTKVFRDFWLRPRVTAVAGLDLEVRRGEVFGLLGPNGSGKSTTIKALLGLLRPTRGSIEVLQRPPSDVAVKKRLGFLPEESYLYPFLSAAETLDFFGRLFGLDRESRQRRAAALLDLVGLREASQRRVGEFSKGMQRRLGLAQALINDPELLILDEPTSGLDPVGAREVKDLVLELRRRGVTVFLSSHLLADVEEVCDRVAILHAGRLQALGPIAELLAVSGRQVFETERLEPATVEKLRELLRREEGKAIERVETPRKRLEAYFLEIVGRAAAGAGAEAGVAWALKVPEFLGRSTGWQPDGAEIPVSSGGP